MNLEKQKQIYLHIRESLLAQHPDLAEDEQALLDTLEGETDFTEAVATLYEAARRAKDMAEAATGRQSELGERKARFMARHDAIRKSIAHAMTETGVKKIEAPNVTISVRAPSPQVIVIDETAIPKDYITVKTTLVPDKAALREMLIHGETVPGVTLSNGEPSITARVK